LRFLPDARDAPLREPEHGGRSDVMTEIFWLIVPYAFICGVLGTVAYVMVEIFGDGRPHQHRLARGTR